MAMTVHVWIRGSTQGEIRGDSTISSMGREGSIEAFKFDHTVHISSQTQSGLATGHRVHSPITITKRID